MSYEYHCTRLHQTDRAVLVRDDESREETWVPFSHVESMHFNAASQKGSIIVSDWIAEKKGWSK